MSLVVEDGTHKTNATSYQSVAGAAAYLAVHALAADYAVWTAASATVQENALIHSTQYLEITQSGRWRGLKATYTQSLAWPRAGAVDNEGFLIQFDYMPQELQAACAELALRVVLGDDLLAVQMQPGDVVAETISVGPIHQQRTYLGSRPAAGYAYPHVEALLRNLVEPGNRVYRA